MAIPEPATAPTTLPVTASDVANVPAGGPSSETDTPGRVPVQPLIWTRPDSVLTLGTLPGLLFDLTEMTVRAGDRVKLIFNNSDDMPHNFLLVATEDSAMFSEAELVNFDAIVFLLTTGDVLDDAQQAAMEGYIRAGGGYVGVHSATDTEWRGDWTWYRKLAGGVFKSHPAVRKARLRVMRSDHLATAALPEVFWHVDEWYDFTDLYEHRIDLLTVDESTYSGGRHGDYHPIAWYHEFDGGRSFYTGLGHTIESYSSPKMRAHLLGGLAYAAGRQMPKNR